MRLQSLPVVALLSIQGYCVPAVLLCLFSRRVHLTKYVYNNGSCNQAVKVTEWRGGKRTEKETGERTWINTRGLDGYATACMHTHTHSNHKQTAAEFQAC